MTDLVSNPSPEKRPRLRCQATTKAGVQCRSTAVSDIDGLCSLHGGRLDPVELGRKGGRARGKKAKAGGFRAAVRGLLERDPERYAQELLDSGAAGFKLASELLREEEAKQQEQQAGPIVVDGQKVNTISDTVRVAASLGQLGLFLDADALRLCWEHVEGGGGVPEESRSPKIPARNDASTSASVDDQDPPETEPLPTLETDDLVDPLPALPIPVSEDSIAPIPKNESGGP